MNIGPQPFHSPERIRRSPSLTLRAVARISAMVMSAVSSVRTPGVLVTVMPRCLALARSMWSTPVPNEAISRRLGLAWEEDGIVDPVGDGRNQNIGGLGRLDELGLLKRPVLEVQLHPEQLHHPGLDTVRSFRVTTT